MPWTWRNQRLPFRFRSESEGSSPCPQLQLPVMASKDHSVWSKTSTYLARPTDLYINTFNQPLPTSRATRPPLQGCCQCCHDLKWAPSKSSLEMRYAATHGNVDPQWRNPILPEMAKFCIVLLYRTQETIQRLMITGHCKFQLEERAWYWPVDRENNIVYVLHSPAKKVNQSENLFQTGIKVMDSSEICWIYHELPWATKLAVTGERRWFGEQTKDLPNGMLPSASKAVMQFVSVCANKMESQIQVSWLTLTLFTQNLNLLIPLKTTEIS